MLLKDNMKTIDNAVEVFHKALPKEFGYVIILAPYGESGEMRDTMAVTSVKPENAALMMEFIIDKIKANASWRSKEGLKE